MLILLETLRFILSDYFVICGCEYENMDKYEIYASSMAKKIVVLCIDPILSRQGIPVRENSTINRLFPVPVLDCSVEQNQTREVCVIHVVA